MLRIALAQFDFPVGDVRGNLKRAKRYISDAQSLGADLVLFPELALTGYPPEDLLLRPGFMRAAQRAVEELCLHVSGIDVVIGHPWMEGGNRFNALSWIRDGKVLGRYFKHCLPNYAVFDEARYFTAGQDPLILEVKGFQVAVLVCEDAWEPEPMARAQAVGADLFLVSNASPYREDKQIDRNAMFLQRASESGLPMVYCNLVGGQDELVFDGRSCLVDGNGEVVQVGGLCDERLLCVDVEKPGARLNAIDWSPPPSDARETFYTVLVRGLKDYVHKNGFSDVVFGLSGGIDSALTLALAVDAIGAEKVHVVMMPSKHTSQLSLDLAREQAELLGVDYQVISIEASFDVMTSELEASFRGRDEDVTEENLQARIRGNFIMALSNKFGWLPLATSNKSELAVGYSTIYGDMCGGFAPLKDCLKTRVYELCEYRNTLGAAIPQAVIDRPPSAELRPDQLDQDSLPEYEILDDILHRFVDLDWSIEDIVEHGHDDTTVRRVAGMVLLNEYKRRQGAPGTRITSRGFGRDRRYPITSGWRENLWGV